MKQKRSRQAANIHAGPTNSPLVDSLLDRFPLPLDQMPPPIREVVDEAIQLASEGDLGMVTALLRSMDEVETSIERDASVPVRQFALSDESAAEYLRALDSSDTEEDFIAAAQKAIDLDEHSVDAYQILGDLADTPEERVKHYRRACQAAGQRDNDTVAAVMPNLRLHMSHLLINDGCIADAAQILFPAIDEDPRDRSEARYLIVELCLRLGWYDELDQTIDRFKEDNFGPIDFARALSSFARNGKTRRATALLVAADDQHPGVAPYLVGRRSMPREGDRISAIEEQAVSAAEYLLPGIREIEGAKSWIRSTLADSLAEHDCRDDRDGPIGIDELSPDELIGRARRDPLGTAIELIPLDTTWKLAIEKADNSSDYTAVIVDAEELVAAERFDRRPGAKNLRPFILRAITDPNLGIPRKPRQLQVSTKADVKALGKYCSSFGVDVVQATVSSEERRMLKLAINGIAKQLGKDADISSDRRDLPLDDLSVTDETWLYGIFRPPMWIHDGPTPRRTHLQLVLDTSQGLILHHAITDTAPTIDSINDTIRSAMRSPLVGDPRRPSSVMIDPASEAANVLDFARKLTECVPGTDFSVGNEQLKTYFDDVVGDMLSNHGPTDRPIAALDDLDPRLLAEFYRTVASFHVAKPWKMVGGDQMFDVKCSSWENSTKTGCVIGQLGQELGFALYDDPQIARQMLNDRDTGQWA